MRDIHHEIIKSFLLEFSLSAEKVCSSELVKFHEQLIIVIIRSDIMPSL